MVSQRRNFGRVSTSCSSVSSSGHTTGCQRPSMAAVSSRPQMPCGAMVADPDVGIGHRVGRDDLCRAAGAAFFPCGANLLHGNSHGLIVVEVAVAARGYPVHQFPQVAVSLV